MRSLILGSILSGLLSGCLITPVKDSIEPWVVPEGFYRYNSKIAWRPVKDKRKDCPVERCIRVEVITASACPSMLYGKVSIIDNNSRKRIGFTSDSTANIAANKKTVLIMPDTTGGGGMISSRLVELECY